jgi:hypothetical protein
VAVAIGARGPLHRDPIAPTIGPCCPHLDSRRTRPRLRRPSLESLDAIRAFAGEDYERPVLEPRARELPARFDDLAVHYDTSPFPR